MAWEVKGNAATFDGRNFSVAVSHDQHGLIVVAIYKEEARELTGDRGTEVWIPQEVLDQLKANSSEGK